MCPKIMKEAVGDIGIKVLGRQLKREQDIIIVNLCTLMVIEVYGLVQGLIMECNKGKQML